MHHNQLRQSSFFFELHSRFCRPSLGCRYFHCIILKPAYLLQDGLDFLAIKSVVKTITQKDDQGQALTLLVWTCKKIDFRSGIQKEYFASEFFEEKKSKTILKNFSKIFITWKSIKNRRFDGKIILLTLGWLWGENTGQFVQHPVRWGIETLEMFLLTTSHFKVLSRFNLNITISRYFSLFLKKNKKLKKIKCALVSRDSGNWLRSMLASIVACVCVSQRTEIFIFSLSQ